MRTAPPLDFGFSLVVLLHVAFARAPLLCPIPLSFTAMSSQSGNPISPPLDAAGASAGGVRRHHTISASSRAARPTSKIALDNLDDPQAEQLWNDDELVDQDWVGGIGAVGEKSSLHRQASLPTRYHRGKYIPDHLALLPLVWALYAVQ